jgi:hypothetical protein
MYLQNFWWSAFNKFPSYLKNSLFRIPSFLGL